MTMINNIVLPLAGISREDPTWPRTVLAGTGRTLPPATFTLVSLDAAAEGKGGPQISSGSGPTAWIIPTNEELVIARQMRGLLGAVQSRLAS